MDTESCKVLVQTDDAGRVTAINSDAFVSGDGWTADRRGRGRPIPARAEQLSAQAAHG